MNYTSLPISTKSSLSKTRSLPVINGLVDIRINVYHECTLKESECPYTRQCAQHETTGDFRIFDGDTPLLAVQGSSWYCERAHTSWFGKVVVNAYSGGYEVAVELDINAPYPMVIYP